MTKNIKNKHGLLKRAKDRCQYCSSVAWQLTILIASAYASYKLFNAVSGKSEYNFADYIQIVAATALGVSAVTRVAQLLVKEASHERSAE